MTLLQRQPGNPMHLDPGRPKQMVAEARGAVGYIIGRRVAGRPGR